MNENELIKENISKNVIWKNVSRVFIYFQNSSEIAQLHSFIASFSCLNYFPKAFPLFLSVILHIKNFCIKSFSFFSHTPLQSLLRKKVGMNAHLKMKIFQWVYKIFSIISKQPLQALLNSTTLVYPIQLGQV